MATAAHRVRHAPAAQPSCCTRVLARRLRARLSYDPFVLVTYFFLFANTDSTFPRDLVRCSAPFSLCAAGCLSCGVPFLRVPFGVPFLRVPFLQVPFLVAGAFPAGTFPAGCLSCGVPFLRVPFLRVPFLVAGGLSFGVPFLVPGVCLFLVTGVCLSSFLAGDFSLFLVGAFLCSW